MGYKVWQSVPVEVREKVAEREYSTLAGVFGSAPRTILEDGHHACPLGVGLREMGITGEVLGWSSVNPFPAVPFPSEVAQVLGIQQRLAASFINAWDNGKIKNLRSAMGLPPKKPEVAGAP